MKLSVAPAALAELQDTAAFYSARANARLGLAFVAEFERVTQLVLANPKIGRIFRDDIRRFVMRRFPYNVYYQIAPGGLHILAIAHQSRRPAYWANRK